MENNSLSLEDILKAREDRAAKQRQLLAEYKKSLISFTLNIPGNNKNKAIYKDIFFEGFKAISVALEKQKLLHNEVVFKKAGLEAYICADIDPVSLKKLTASIEETHTLGRIFDIDVLDRDGNIVSRTDIGLSPRSCMLCEESAALCSRSQSHELEELLSYIETQAKAFLNQT